MRITVTTNQGIMVEQLEEGKDFDLTKLMSVRPGEQREARLALARDVTIALCIAEREEAEGR